MNRTPLHNDHLELSAKMVDFAGWHMPIQYPTGILEEHLAVRNKVGMFDVSHMGQLRISGADALDFLRFATLNDPAKLSPGRGQYSMIPNDQGGLVDDIYLYQLREIEFLVICNAANDAAVTAQLNALAGPYEVIIVHESDQWGLIAVQGPEAETVLNSLVDVDLSEVKKNRIVQAKLTGARVPLQIARTGYTGEDGFEVLCAASDSNKLWDALLQAEVVPCGLGARDTLRLEAGFPLFGHDFTESTNPLCSSYAWVVKDKDFFGRDSLWNPSCTRKLVGLTLLDKGIPREGYEVLDGQGEVIGVVTSGTLSPVTGAGIALAWLEQAHCELDSKVNVQIRRKVIPASVSKPPFYPAKSS
ncbi:MAG: glycine cleavage system aminomethyltransferase GcvT [Deinococcota bacterium]